MWRKLEFIHLAQVRRVHEMILRRKQTTINWSFVSNAGYLLVGELSEQSEVWPRSRLGLCFLELGKHWWSRRTLILPLQTPRVDTNF